MNNVSEGKIMWLVLFVVFGLVLPGNAAKRDAYLDLDGGRALTQQEKRFLAIERNVREQGISRTEENVKKERKQVDKRIKKAKARTRRKQRKITREFKRNLSRQYRSAIRLFKAGKYEQAEAVFKNVESLQSNYRLTQKYLGQINENIIEQRKKIKDKERQGAVLKALDQFEGKHSQ